MPSTSPDDHHETDERPLQVLVVDDDPVQRHHTGLVVGRLGHEVTSAACGEDAVAIALARPFDAVLMDIDMPGMDGFTAARAIRDGLGASASPSIIALTSYAHEESQFLTAGMEGRLHKPCRIVDLCDRLGHVLGSREDSEGRGQT